MATVIMAATAASGATAATAATASMAATPTASVSEDGAFDAGQQHREENNSNGLPAGEPDYEAQVLNGTLQVDEPNASVHADLGWAGSCAKYGCHTSYHPGFRCQCSPSCHKYRNCCGDYEAQCSAQPAKEGHYRGAVKIVYHATSKEAGHSILKHGFRPLDQTRARDS